jgi:hypothetical protein
LTFLRRPLTLATWRRRRCSLESEFLRGAASAWPPAPVRRSESPSSAPCRGPAVTSRGSEHEDCGVVVDNGLSKLSRFSTRLLLLARAASGEVTVR